jgi:hypothetical protein
MAISTQLFEGKLIRLGAIDHEKDPEVESRWTHDLSYLRTLERDAGRPLSPEHMKKRYEKIEKSWKNRRTVSTSPSAAKKMTGCWVLYACSGSNGIMQQVTSKWALATPWSAVKDTAPKP